MPNKTIYVAEDDLPIFEQAQALAGESLSATIMQALRQYVERHEMLSEGYRSVDLPIGTMGKTRKQFTGRLLTHGKQLQKDNQKTLIKYEVYQTPKGNFVLYRKQINTEHHRAEKYLDVYPSLDELREHIPLELVDQLTQRLQGSTVEVLDI